MKPSLQHSLPNTAVDPDILPEAAILTGAASLARAIQRSAEWREMVSAQKAAQEDPQYSRMIARHNELSRMQNGARSHAGGLDGKSLVELITLREQLQRHELYRRQQEAGSAVVRLLHRVTQTISQELGFDFASNASPRGGECCG